MDKKIVIFVSGGVVTGVFSSGDVSVSVVDLDNDPVDGQREYDETFNDKSMYQVY